MKTAPTNDELVCKICGGGLFLICQLHAPFEELDRSLYVFACSKEACSLQAKGWVVFRNQSSLIVTDPVVSPPPPPLAVEPKPVASGFNFSFEDDDDDLSELVAMIDSRDAKNTSNSCNNNAFDGSEATAPPIAVTEPVSVNCRYSNNYYPAWSISDEYEDDGSMPTSILNKRPPIPQPASNPGNRLGHANNNFNGRNVSAANGGEGTEEEDDDDDSSDDDSETGDDDKILAMLDSYARLEEENVALVQQLKSSMSQKASKANKGKKCVSDKKVVDSNKIAVYPGKSIRPLLLSKGTRTAPGSNGAHLPVDSARTAAVAGNLPKEWTQYRNKLENYFQRRISFHPNQCIRYDYGGMPLWCSIAYPGMFESPFVAPTSSSQKKTKATLPTVCMINDGLVPPCEYCGSKRVYEFQLMPSILSLYSKVQIQPPPSTEEGVGLDFGVVAIYVCPDSCNVGSVCRECVVVQASADMIR